jgi:elongation factor Ts
MTRKNYMATMVSAKEIQELRARTGAGITDCKNALTEAGGDMQKAVEILRKRGIAKGEKRVGRAASEGRIVSMLSPDHRHAVLVEVNSETDFVARNDDFVRLAEQLAQQVMHDAATDAVVDKAEEGTLLGQRWHADGGQTVGDVVKGASGRTGENIVLRRYARFASEGAIGRYVHHDGKLAVLVEVGGANNDAARQLARTLAEHIAAGVPAVPAAVSREQVPSDLVARERRIFAEQARESGKPENIVEKMVQGRVDKFYKEVVLVDQPWVRDDSKTIGDLVREASSKTGENIVVRRFARFQIGAE